MKAQKFNRKTFQVDAVQVTAENLDEVAMWCNGEVRWGSPKPGKPVKKFVKVRVLRPLNERQTMAFPNDWVVYAGTGYKIYTSRAFHDSFEAVVEDDPNYGQHLVDLDEPQHLPV